MENGKIIFSRENLIEKLKELKASPKPEIQNISAMCYEMAAPPDRYEYICPGCQSRTIYTGSESYTMQELIPYARYTEERLSRFPLKLEEKGFCRVCYPAVTEKTLCLHIHYKDETNPVTTCGLSVYDLQILAEFLEGKDKHTGNFDDESPLFDHIGRIEELLGLKSK